MSGSMARKEVWRPEEDAIILHAVSLLGPRWAQVASQLPLRSEAAVRNRYLRLNKAREARELESALAEMLPDTLEPYGLTAELALTGPSQMEEVSPTLFRSLDEMLAVASERWLRKEEVLDVLLHPDAYGLSLTDELGCRELQPVSGTLLLINKALNRNFRNDSLIWRTRQLARGGRGLAETHERLKVDGSYELICRYSTTVDGSISRRIYSRIADKDLVLVQYFAAAPVAYAPEQDQPTSQPEHVSDRSVGHPGAAFSSAAMSLVTREASTGQAEALTVSFGAGELLAWQEQSPQAPQQQEHPRGHAPTPLPAPADATGSPTLARLAELEAELARVVFEREAERAAAREAANAAAARIAQLEACVRCLEETPPGPSGGREVCVQAVVKHEAGGGSRASPSAALQHPPSGSTLGLARGCSLRSSSESTPWASPHMLPLAGSAALAFEAPASPKAQASVSSVQPSSLQAGLSALFSPLPAAVAAAVIPDASPTDFARLTSMTSAGSAESEGTWPLGIAFHSVPSMMASPAGARLTPLAARMVGALPGSPGAAFDGASWAPDVVMDTEPSPAAGSLESKVDSTTGRQLTLGMSAHESPAGVSGGLEDAGVYELSSEAYAMAVSLSTELEVGLEHQFRELILSLNQGGENGCEAQGAGARQTPASQPLGGGETSTARSLAFEPSPVKPPFSPYCSRSTSLSPHRSSGDLGSTSRPAEEWLAPGGHSAPGSWAEGAQRMRQPSFGSPWVPGEAPTARAASSDGMPRRDELLTNYLAQIDLTRLCRIQLRIRQRLQLRERRVPGHNHTFSRHMGSGSSSGLLLPRIGSPRDEAGAALRLGASSLGVIKGAQVRFRTRKHKDSRRRAASAIVRFYRNQQRQSRWGGRDDKHSAGTRSEHGVMLVDGPDVRATLGSDTAVPTASTLQARAMRLSAVRLIERAYWEWKYHGEQARLAAEGSIDGGPDSELHSYHAERRACAARCIQQYLTRQQFQQRPVSQPGSSSGGQAAAPSRGDGYTAAQLEVIRRVQRNFRAHLHKQAEAAHELHHTSLRQAGADAGAHPHHAHLCDILRRVYRERKQRAAEEASSQMCDIFLTE